MKLVVDVEAERVRLGTSELGGQWVDFYALLALARTEEGATEGLVTAASLFRVGPWRHKKFDSVGKEVARKLDGLAHGPLGRAVACKGRTRSWRLALPPGAVVFHPSREAVRAWVSSRTLGMLPDGNVADELSPLVEATAALQRGDADGALRWLDRLPATLGQAEPALTAWSALLRARAAAQFDDDDDALLSALDKHWSGRADAPSRAVSARIRALMALRYRFGEPAATLASLGKLAADLELRGDIGSLSAVVNVMGLLARRAGDPETGAANHLRAAALSGINGDLATLQATLYNLALCRKEALARGGKPPDEAVLTLIDLCLRVCARFGVGDDSAQAEISGATWAMERGDHKRAREYFEAAEKLVSKLDSTYDQACFLELRAALELADPQGRSDPAHDLQTAEMLFAKAGDHVSAARLRKRLTSSRGVGGSLSQERHRDRRQQGRERVEVAELPQRQMESLRDRRTK